MSIKTSCFENHVLLDNVSFNYVDLLNPNFLKGLCSYVKLTADYPFALAIVPKYLVSFAKAVQKIDPIRFWYSYNCSIHSKKSSSSLHHRTSQYVPELNKF